MQFILMAAVIALTAGCGPRKWDDKTVKLESGEIQKIFFDAPLVDKATIKVSSPGAPINAHVVLQVDLQAAERLIKDNKAPKDALAGAEKTQEKEFEVAPGRKEFALILWGASRECSVRVTASGK
jgi:hypothetical protein